MSGLGGASGCQGRGVGGPISGVASTFSKEPAVEFNSLQPGSVGFQARALTLVALQDLRTSGSWSRSGWAAERIRAKPPRGAASRGSRVSMRASDATKGTGTWGASAMEAQTGQKEP